MKEIDQIIEGVVAEDGWMRSPIDALLGIDHSLPTLDNRHDWLDKPLHQVKSGDGLPIRLGATVWYVNDDRPHDRGCCAHSTMHGLRFRLQRPPDPRFQRVTVSKMCSDSHADIVCHICGTYMPGVPLSKLYVNKPYYMGGPS